MRAVFQPLHSAAHPQRQPYVRALSFVDGKGPPPFDFFDQFQDHQAALFGALSGWSYSSDRDEFTEAWFRSNYLGSLQQSRRVNMVATPDAAPDEVGVHGVASVLGGAGPYSFTASGVFFGLGGDFLLTTKVKLVGVANLDTASARGFVAGLGPPVGLFPYPAFVAGGDSPNWRLRYSPDNGASAALQDSGIPVQSGVWYRLQISRVAGAVRWFVNGQLARFNGGLEGSYYPAVLADARRHIEISRTAGGAANEGFYIDSCHLLAARSSP